MPRKGPLRPKVSIRLSEAGIEVIDKMADAETNGNRSEMARRLMKYALDHYPRPTASL